MKVVFIKRGCICTQSDVMVKEVKGSSEIKVYRNGKELRRITSVEKAAYEAKYAKNMEQESVAENIKKPELSKRKITRKKEWYMFRTVMTEVGGFEKYIALNLDTKPGYGFLTKYPDFKRGAKLYELRNTPFVWQVLNVYGFEKTKRIYAHYYMSVEALLAI